MSAVTATHPEAVAGTLGSTMAREVNATFAIAWREVLRAIKSPVSLAFTVVFPILFIGVLGGSISANLSGALPYAYLPFMLIGMIANSMYQGTITGVTNLVEERENDFTAELFVAPISRYAVLVACPGTKNCWIYTVRSGDNFRSIVNWFGVPYDTVLRMNPQIGNPTNIRAGDKIRMPPPTR